MRPIGTFTVTPVLPPELARIRELALNLRWAWNQSAIELFRSLDDDLWESTNHNPVRMLGEIDQAKLVQAAADPGFLSQLERVADDFDEYMAGTGTWWSQRHRPDSGPLVAYFSAEFGITDCLSIFAGGLGLLAGDPLKSASDLGLPLVAVGLLYQQGYFRQYLNEAGWQQEAYEDNDFSTLPLTLVRLSDGAPLVIEIRLPARPVRAQVWRAQVGRVSLYLMDTNVAANRLPEDRDITDQLYGGDNEMRLKQEILLGIGGCRVLSALGLDPRVYHMNEGHSAFLALERITQLMDLRDLTFAEARELASAGLVFTTHTPVPAGHDRFPPNLMEMYFGDYYKNRLGLTRAEFLALGRERPGDEGEWFSMTTLALRLSACSNGVSELHGKVSRDMERGLWPNVPVNEIPIGHVTNGVHFQSWISRETEQLYDRYLGARWRQEPGDARLWHQIERVPAEELWRTHERRRERMLVYVRRRLREQLARRGALRSEVEAADDVLDLEALTIGFARRFATYKRATLLFRDPERLARLLNNPDRPVQVVFAGKAHPHDNGGKELIQQIIAFSRQPQFHRRIVFIEDYGMATARYLVQGCDVWLNNPLRPMEASGTSGMKALANGVLNMSTLDGWWDEAWNSADPHQPPVGWAIGRGESYDNLEYQDQVEAEALYNLLEHDVVPTFYDRGPDELPRRWIAHMKSSIGQLCPFYNTHRMVREYAERFYLPSIDRFERLAAGETDSARSIATWRMRVEQAWPGVRVESVEAEPPEKPVVGCGLSVRAKVCLNGLKPEDVAVQLYLGRVDGKGEIVDAESYPLQMTGSDGDGHFTFGTSGVSTTRSGLHGYTVRVLPSHADLSTKFLPGLITWAVPEAAT